MKNDSMNLQDGALDPLSNAGVVLTTERLTLRLLVPTDAAALALVLCDSVAMRYYPRPFSPIEVDAWIARNQERYQRDGFGLWGVVRKSDGRFLGDCGITLQTIDGALLPEIGYHIIAPYCSQGYATEAASACLHLAFTQLDLSSVYSYSHQDNTPSQRVAEKIGLHFWKSYREDSTIKVVYRVFRD